MVYGLYGQFDPTEMEFRIRTDSVEGQIRTDSDGFLDPKYGGHQPRPGMYVCTCHVIGCH